MADASRIERRCEGCVEKTAPDEKHPLSMSQAWTQMLDGNGTKGLSQKSKTARWKWRCDLLVLF